MNVEDEAQIALRFEPVYVVFLLGDRRDLTGLEGFISARFENHAGAVIFLAVVQSALKFSVQDQKRGTHVVVTVGNNRSSFL